MEQGSSPVFLRTEPSPVLPPPVFAGGPVKWMRENMLAGPGSAMFTLLGLLFVVWVTPGLVRYLFIDAVWSSPDGVACRAPGAGACSACSSGDVAACSPRIWSSAGQGA